MRQNRANCCQPTRVWRECGMGCHPHVQACACMCCRTALGEWGKSWWGKSTHLPGRGTQAPCTSAAPTRESSNRCSPASRKKPASKHAKAHTHTQEHTHTQAHTHTPPPSQVRQKRPRLRSSQCQWVRSAAAPDARLLPCAKRSPAGQRHRGSCYPADSPPTAPSTPSCPSAAAETGRQHYLYCL